MDEKILEVLRKNRDSYISGEELSHHFSVSRTTIWKHIEGLRGIGYDIQAQPNLGYRLVSVPDSLLANEIKANLKTKLVGKEIFSFEETQSTMDVARNLAANGAPEGTVVFAEHQTQGRGRMGRSWLSPRGEGIWASIILRPNFSPGRAPSITIMAALAVAEAIRETTHLSASIKWPNDILIRGKKIGGILTEMVAEMDMIEFVIVGIGVNVSLKIEDLPKSLHKKVSCLKDELGEGFPRIPLAQEILRKLDQFYLLLKSEGFDSIAEKWRSLSATLGKHIKASFQGATIEGQAVDIDSDGALVVRLDNGFCERLTTGDVEIL